MHSTDIGILVFAIGLPLILALFALLTDNANAPLLKKKR